MDPTEASRALLDEVLARYEGSPSSPRQRLITEAAIRHLHAFVVEVGLTRDEWMAGIQFLTATGRICDEVRQEFVLLSDTLGLSSVVDALTNSRTPDSTPSAVLGPFYVDGPPAAPCGADIAGGAAGIPLWADIRVTDPDGRPVGVSPEADRMIRSGTGGLY
jgi:hypothetical protein